MTTPNDHGSNGDMDRLKESEYDGIREYDNPLPNWWLMTFFGTIIFGAIYFLHYEVGGGSTLLEELKEERAELQQDAQASLANGGVPAAAPEESEESLQKLFQGIDMKAGNAVFQSKCMPCHRADGGGLVGPNLADEYWIHGKGSRADILLTIRKGVPDKGMLAWETQLKPEEILQVGAFVYSLRETNPENPKPPQGDKYPKN